MSASDRGVRPSFGHAGHPWPLDLDADPSATAARYLQHRVIVAARERLGEEATAADFARRLGARFSEKKVQRHLGGGLPLRIDELLYWCHALDLNIGELVGRGIADTALNLPPLYSRQRLSRPGTPPRLEGALTDVGWQEVASDLVLRVVNELEGAESGGSLEESSHFVTSEVLRHYLRRDLVFSRGISAPLVKPRPSGLELLGPRGHVVGTFAATSDDLEAWAAVRTALVSPSCDVIVLCLGITTTALSDQEFPGLLSADVGTVYSVPDLAHEAAGVPLTGPVNWALRGVGAAANLHLLVLERKTSGT